MLPFGVTIPATVPQRPEIPEGLLQYPVYYRHFGTRHVRERKENSLLKLLRFWAFTFVSHSKENKRL
jgi:hypothetical protein